MKLAVFALLLVVLPFQAEASSYVCDTLIVEVMEGRGLTGDGWMGPPEPYVKAIVDGHVQQTHAVHNSYDPIWEEDLKFNNVKSDKLVIEIWEYDDFFHGGDDHLETCEEKIKLGSHLLSCGRNEHNEVAYGVHCLKGNMKRSYLEALDIFGLW